MWIEELIGRRRSLRADQIVAVSSSGFTRPALKKAREHQILAFRMSEVNCAELSIVLEPPRYWMPVVRNWAVKVEVEVPASMQQELASEFEENWQSIFGDSLEASFDYIRNRQDYGSNNQGRDSVDVTIPHAVTVKSCVLNSRLNTSFNYDSIELRFASRPFSQDVNGLHIVDAEAHGADYEGWIIEILVTPEDWRVIFDARQARLAVGTVLPPRGSISSRHFGMEKNIIFDYRHTADAPFMGTSSYSMRCTQGEEA